MRHTFRRFLFVLITASLAGLTKADDDSMFTIVPVEYSGALSNPLKGFRPPLGDKAIHHEYATLARHYIKWNELENHERDTTQKIRDFCDEKWKGVEQLGIKVIPRVYLDWDGKEGNEYWPADMKSGDYSSEQFKERLERLIARLGEAWDNDPRVAWVQMGIIGHWGEHHSPDVTAEIQALMGDAFTKAFQKKKFLVRHADSFEDYEVGYYWDSWAHNYQVSKSSHGAGIEDVNNATGRWKICPIEGEVAYNWGSYQIQPGDNPDDTLSDPAHRDFLIDTIRNLHCSGLGWISHYNSDDPKVSAGAAEVQKAFGYRFVLPEFCWSRRGEPDGSLRLSFSVINTGSAPFYESWPVEFSLLDPVSGLPVWKTTLKDVDIRQWLPGDNWDESRNVYLTPAQTNTVDVSIPLPDKNKLPIGEYIVALAIVEPLGLEPNVRFAVNNYFKGGRHPFGRVGIGVDVAGTHELDSVTFDDPMQDGRQAYVTRIE